MRSSRTLSQIFVPVSTMDWCISCFTWSTMPGEAADTSCITCERSSQVAGIDDLEFFFYTDGEAVSHGWPSVLAWRFAGLGLT